MKKILMFIGALIMSGAVQAWTPQRPVNVYIGYSPGSTNEQVFRKISDIVAGNNPGVRFLITARPGADGSVAQNHLVQQPNDGYHISVPSIVSLFIANDIWQKDIKNYQWDSFINLAVLGETPSAIIAPIDSKINNARDLVLAFQKPEKPINVAISGGTGRIAYEYFMHTVKGDRSKIVHINYQNASQTVIAVGGNQVDFSFVPMAAAKAGVESGKVKIVAITSKKTLDSMPGVSLLSDVLPEFEIYSGWFITMPAGTDPQIVEWYQREFSRAIRSDKYKQWAKQNLILVNESLLDPPSVTAYAKKLRRDLSPSTRNIKPE